LTTSLQWVAQRVSLELPSWLFVGAFALTFVDYSFAVGPVHHLRPADLAAAASVVITLLLLWWRRELGKIRFDLVSAAFVLLGASAAISATAAASSERSLAAVLQFLEYAAVWITADAAFATGRFPRLTAFWGLTIAAVVQSGLGVSQPVLGAGPFADRFSGLGTTGLSSGVLIGIAEIFLFWRLLHRKSRPLLTFAIVIVLSAGLVATETRTAWAALILGICGVYWSRVKTSAITGRRLAAGAAVTVLLLASVGLVAWVSPLRERTVQRLESFVLLVQGNTVDAGNWTLLVRIGLWETAVSMFESSPIVGVGAKNFPDRLKEFESPTLQTYETFVGKSETLESPHNQILLIASEQGILGIAALLLLLAALLRGVRRLRNSAKAGWYSLATGLLLLLLAQGILGEFLYGQLGLATTLALVAVSGPATSRRSTQVRNTAEARVEAVSYGASEPYSRR
jgi:O-antigen ligase